MAKATQGQFNILKQICEHIPGHLVTKAAQEYGVSKQARTFSPWSHLVSLIYAQASHSLSLNDVCDSMNTHSGKLIKIRGAVPPKRNTLSYANTHRDPRMAEKVFWDTLTHLQSKHPGFGRRRKYKQFPRRFKKVISAIDSSTISLVANCMDWAKHRRRKAAAKLHLTLDLETFLPRFALVEKAKHHDSTLAEALAATLEPGEIAVFDKAYIKFAFLYTLTGRGVFWVGRAKDNMQYKTIEKKKIKEGSKIIRDELIILTNDKSFEQYPESLRLVEAWVEVNGKDQKMVFITNNKEWAPSSVCDLYKCRWGIEVFFKEMKQSLKLTDFLGYSANAVLWQIWTALLTYLLVRFISYAGQWTYSFKRLFTVLRALLWHNFNLYEHLKDFYGTASGPCRIRSVPGQAFLPGLEHETYGTA